MKEWKNNNDVILFFTISDFDVLRMFKRNEEIITSKPDKGRGLVIMNKADYFNKMEDILMVRELFEKIIDLDPLKKEFATRRSFE